MSAIMGLRTAQPLITRGKRYPGVYFDFNPLRGRHQLPRFTVKGTLNTEQVLGTVSRHPCGW